MRWRWLASGVVGVAVIVGIAWLTSGGGGELDRAGAVNALRARHDERSGTPASAIKCTQAGNVWRCEFREGDRPCLGSVAGDAGNPQVSYFCSEPR
jgi:hypothetical protein